jgi:hypothetical protein
MDCFIEVNELMMLLWTPEVWSFILEHAKVVSTFGALTSPCSKPRSGCVVTKHTQDTGLRTGVWLGRDVLADAR